MAYVYVLFTPWDAQPCYVGKGTGNRAHHHNRHGVLHKNEHLAAIYARATGPLPVIILRDGLTEEQALEAERALIEAIGRLDLGTGPLCNQRDGGEKTSNFSHETKAKISTIAKASMNTPEAKARVAANSIRRGMSEETKAKISASVREKFKDPEVLARISAASSRNNRNRSLETLAKVSASSRAAHARPGVSERMQAGLRRKSGG